MSKHVFFTGSKQIGKSTIIQNFLKTRLISYAGFLTVRSDTVFPGIRSVHMLNLKKNEVPSKENFLFFCGQSSYECFRQYDCFSDPASRFNQIGCSILESIPSDSDLIIMDEIGPHECEAFSFCSSIFHCLDGNIPILGVLQQSETDLFRGVALHPDVDVIEVTTKNRNQLVAIIDRWLL